MAPTSAPELAFLAHHDPLTGLANRAALEEALELAVADARVTGSCSRSPSRRGRSRRLLPVLGELRAAGFALAIDDFGAGYSSLWRLREVPVQIIKVDRAFLTGVPDEPQAAAVYAAILQLAEACGCDVVAEGVEEAEQVDFLLSSGCRIARGFHFSRPAPAAEVTPLLEASMAPDRRS
jgi:EAL domain-containing protein (putative c-di-GMP-specific phosphodiesterase class I)